MFNNVFNSQGIQLFVGLVGFCFDGLGSGAMWDQFEHIEAAFMLILRRQNQRFETLIQNADPKRPSREYCSCFPREEDDFVSMHCALFEAIVRAQVNRKGVYMTSFKRGYM